MAKYIVYHGTSQQFDRFDLNRSAQGIIWFSDDRDSIVRGDAGAAGRSIILKCQVNINNPAGWNEYEKYGIGELKGRGYDGIILPDSDHNTYVVFKPSQVKILERQSALQEQLTRMKTLLKR
jgi:hypothetical protein